jgi:hypothetical protein
VSGSVSALFMSSGKTATAAADSTPPVPVLDVSDLTLLPGCGLKLMDTLKSAGLDTIEKVAHATEAPASLSPVKLQKLRDAALALLARMKDSDLEDQELKTIEAARTADGGLAVEIISRAAFKRLKDLREQVKQFLPKELHHYYFRLRREQDKPDYVAVLYLRSVKKHRLLLLAAVRLEQRKKPPTHGAGSNAALPGPPNPSESDIVRIDRIYGDRDFLGRLLQAATCYFHHAKGQRVDLQPMLPRNAPTVSPGARVTTRSTSPAGTATAARPTMRRTLIGGSAAVAQGTAVRSIIKPATVAPDGTARTAPLLGKKVAFNIHR